MKHSHVLVLLLLAFVVITASASAWTQAGPEEKRVAVLEIESAVDVADAVSDVLVPAGVAPPASRARSVVTRQCLSPQGLAPCPPHRPPD